jgi:hypothetical protein
MVVYPPILAVLATQNLNLCLAVIRGSYSCSLFAALCISMTKKA